MKRFVLYSTLFAVLAFSAGCIKQANDTDGIRLGINQHLSALKSLNLSAMDMNIQNLSVQGNQAEAQVEFRPKTGAPQGAGMQVSYKLEKQDGKWVVQNSQPAGGAIEHPKPGENPHQNPASSSPGTLPDFRNLVNPGSGSSLPPGHPPVNSQGSIPPQ